MTNATPRANVPALPTRRAALTTLAGAGAALALFKSTEAAEVATSHPDAAPLALRPRIAAVQARIDAAVDRLGKADLLQFAKLPSPDKEVAEAEEAASHRDWRDLRDEIMAIQATTIAGLCVKATFCPDPWDEDYLMQSVVEDIVAMAGDRA